MKKIMKYIYCWNVMEHKDDKTIFGITNGYKQMKK